MAPDYAAERARAQRALEERLAVAAAGRPVGLLADHLIAERCARAEPMISPFIDQQVRWVERYDGAPGDPPLAPIPVISYGLSSYGYDVRLANQFQVFTPTLDTEHTLVDPKRFHAEFMRAVAIPDHDALVIPPNAYALGHSVERFVMPGDVTGICVGKSTYARCGILVNVTPLEAGWRGYVTIEISNATSLPVKVYAGEGIMQVVFYEGVPCTTSYATRGGLGAGGKYQDQAPEVTTARI